MKNNSIYEQFEGYDRYDLPAGIVRVTAGEGGDVYLIDCGGKTAMYDCGMAYCAEKMIENTKKHLKERGYDSVDYVFVSHSHYDHIGALPYIIKEWPDVKVCGAEKAAKVFRSEGAKALMVKLGTAAKKAYQPEEEAGFDITADGMRVDIILKDGDSINIGSKTITAYETPGHTDCSMSFMLLPEKILFISESTGVLRRPDLVSSAILKSFDDSIASALKCKSLKAKSLIGSHYGHIPEFFTDEYFDRYIETASSEQKIFAGMYKDGASMEEMMKKYDEMHWTKQRAAAQPREAFTENAGHIIRSYINKYISDTEER